MNAICLESVLQRESFTGSANDNILLRVAIKAYVRVCLASACVVCVCVQMWTHLNVFQKMSFLKSRNKFPFPVISKILVFFRFGRFLAPIITCKLSLCSFLIYTFIIYWVSAETMLILQIWI